MHGAPLRRQMRATQRSAFNGRSAACLATRTPNNHCDHDDSENESGKGSEETANAAGRERHSDKHDDPRGERTPESDHGVAVVPCAPPTGLVEKRGERAALQLGEELGGRTGTFAQVAVRACERQVLHLASAALVDWLDMVNMPLSGLVESHATIAAVSSVTGVHCGPVFSGPPPHPVGAFLLLDARSASSLVLPTEVAPPAGALATIPAQSCFAPLAFGQPPFRSLCPFRRTRPVAPLAPRPLRPTRLVGLKRSEHGLKPLRWRCARSRGLLGLSQGVQGPLPVPHPVVRAALRFIRHARSIAPARSLLS